MKRSSFLCVFFCLAVQCYAQKQTIFLQKQEPAIRFVSSFLYEEKDLSQYQIPKGLDGFVIGYNCVSSPHFFYNKSHQNEEWRLKYISKIEEDEIDTLQFITNKLNKIWINTLIYMQNGMKHCIIDTDFDNSFLNEEVFSFNMNDSSVNSIRYYTNLNIPVDSFENSFSKRIPIGIMNSTSSYTGNEVVADSLQVDIFSNVSYRGFFLNFTDTIWVDLFSQNFDQIYKKRGLLGWCSNNSLELFIPLILGNAFKIRNHKYVFKDFDIYNKTLELERLEDDTVGINRGNYFAEMPELSPLHGYSLVFFTGSWCRPCKPVLDSLLIFYDKYPEINMISINQERDSTAFTKHKKDYNIPWKVIYDKVDMGKSLYFSTYYIYEIPQLLLVNPQRRVLLSRKGTNPCIELLKEIKEKGLKSIEINDY